MWDLWFWLHHWGQLPEEQNLFHCMVCHSFDKPLSFGKLSWGSHFCFYQQFWYFKSVWVGDNWHCLLCCIFELCIVPKLSTRDFTLILLRENLGREVIHFISRVTFTLRSWGRKYYQQLALFISVIRCLHLELLSHWSPLQVPRHIPSQS